MSISPRTYSCIIGASLAICSAALPASAAAADVCNEAGNSHRGGYTVAGGPVDPNPPARLRGSQMRVGGGHGAGLIRAAERSPALRTCGRASVEPVGPVAPVGPVKPVEPVDPGEPVAPLNPPDPDAPVGSIAD